MIAQLSVQAQQTVSNSPSGQMDAVSHNVEEMDFQ
jgi:hypothetical protein